MGNALGLGDTTRVLRPHRVLLSALHGTRVRQVSAGGGFIIAVTAAGELYACGCGVRGRLGLGSWEPKDTFTLVTALAGIPVISTSAGESHSVILTEAGVYTMGNGDCGQLGHGDERSPSASCARVSAPMMPASLPCGDGTMSVSAASFEETAGTGM